MLSFVFDWSESVFTATCRAKKGGRTLTLFDYHINTRYQPDTPPKMDSPPRS